MLRSRPALCASALPWLALIVVAVAAAPARADEVGTALYVRTDSDRTLVVAPRVRAQAQVAEPTAVSATYAADVWTSASIDIMTSASAIPVTEQRDEIDLAVDHELSDFNFSVAYRYSTEPDYVSHGVSGGFSYDFAENNSTFALGLSGSADTVGKAGDPDFARPVGTTGARLTFTQVLGRNTIGQVIYDLGRTSGYLSSPYRYVPIGGGACTADRIEPGLIAPLCVPEASPSKRLRHAAALELRQALSNAVALAFGYRFYTDDWSLGSHTARAELVWTFATDALLALRYRFYTQGAAEHYRAVYMIAERYVTSDKELSPLGSHRIGLELTSSWTFAGDRMLTTTLSFAPIFYSYRDFVPLTHITAYEANAALVLTL